LRCIERATEYKSRRDELRVILIGDVHLGNRQSDEKTLRRLARRIREEPHTYWIGLGDYCEFIGKSDPRHDSDDWADWLFDREALRDIARTEYERFLSIMGDVGDKCLALIEGNHEAAIRKHSECDVYGAIVEGLKSKTAAHRLDHRGFLTWRLKRGHNGPTWSLRFYLTHGSNGGRRPGSTANRLEDLANQVDGVDVVIQGHTHKAMHLTPTKFRIGEEHSKTATVHALNIPSLCGDMIYADSKDMGALALGWMELVIVPDKHRIQVVTEIVSQEN